MKNTMDGINVLLLRHRRNTHPGVLGSLDAGTFLSCSLPILRCTKQKSERVSGELPSSELSYPAGGSSSGADATDRQQRLLFQSFNARDANRKAATGDMASDIALLTETA